MFLLSQNQKHFIDVHLPLLAGWNIFCEKPLGLASATVQSTSFLSEWRVWMTQVSTKSLNQCLICYTVLVQQCLPWDSMVNVSDWPLISAWWLRMYHSFIYLFFIELAHQCTAWLEKITSVLWAYCGNSHCLSLLALFWANEFIWNFHSCTHILMLLFLYWFISGLV